MVVEEYLIHIHNSHSKFTDEMLHCSVITTVFLLLLFLFLFTVPTYANVNYQSDKNIIQHSLGYLKTVELNRFVCFIINYFVLI